MVHKHINNLKLESLYKSENI